MDDKYIPWFLATVMFSVGVAGILIYLFMKQQTQPVATIPVVEKPLEMQKIYEKPTQVFTRTYTITSTVKMLDNRSQDDLPWKSFDLTNNGPDPVYFSVNNKDWMEAPLPIGQTINIDLEQKDAIQKLYFKCDAGQTANIRLYIIK